VIAELVSWVLTAPHSSSASAEVGRLFAGVGQALFAGGGLFVMYLAAEPAMRHYWPDSLLGSTRLLRGHVIDGRVGRDVLIGFTVGALIDLTIWLRDPIQQVLGAQYPVLAFGYTGFYDGVMPVIAYLAEHLGFQSMFAAMWCVLGLLGLKRLLKHRWLVGIVGTVALTLLLARGLFIDSQGIAWVNVVSAFIVVGAIVVVAIQAGLLAAAATLFFTNFFTAMPWSLDSNAWYFPQSAVALAVVVAIVGTAGYATSAVGPDGSRRSAL
jgi:hypothetical protein